MINPHPCSCSSPSYTRFKCTRPRGSFHWSSSSRWPSQVSQEAYPNRAANFAETVQSQSVSLSRICLPPLLLHPARGTVVGVEKNNREISLRRVLGGQSVLAGLLEDDALRTEPSLEKLYCARVELQYLLQVCFGSWLSLMVVRGSSAVPVELNIQVDSHSPTLPDRSPRARCTSPRWTCSEPGWWLSPRGPPRRSKQGRKP